MQEMSKFLFFITLWVFTQIFKNKFWKWHIFGMRQIRRSFGYTIIWIVHFTNFWNFTVKLSDNNSKIGYLLSTKFVFIKYFSLICNFLTSTNVFIMQNHIHSKLNFLVLINDCHGTQYITFFSFKICIIKVIYLKWTSLRIIFQKQRHIAFKFLK